MSVHIIWRPLLYNITSPAGLEGFHAHDDVAHSIIIICEDLKNSTTDILRG